MIIPVRCFTCGKVVGDKWEIYKEKIESGYTSKKALDELGMTRYCCRTMLHTHVDLITSMLRYPTHLDNEKSIHQ